MSIVKIIENEGCEFLSRDQRDAIEEFKDLLLRPKIFVYRHMEIASPNFAAIAANPGDHWSFSPDAILENGDVVNIHLTAEIDVSQVNLLESIRCMLGYPEEREVIFSGDVCNLQIEVDN
jgi:hypothetical protein